MTLRIIEINEIRTTLWDIIKLKSTDEHKNRTNYLADKNAQIFGVGLHKLVEFGKLAGSEEHFSHTKLEVVVVQSQGLNKDRI